MIQLSGTGLHCLAAGTRAGIAGFEGRTARLVVLDRAGREQELSVRAGDVFSAGDRHWRVVAIEGGASRAVMLEPADA